MKYLIVASTFLLSMLPLKALEPGRHLISCIEAHFQGARHPYRGYILTKSPEGEFKLEIASNEGSTTKVTSVQVSEDESTGAFLLTAQFEETPKSKSGSAKSNSKPQPTKAALAFSFKPDGSGTGSEVSLFKRGDTTYIFANISQLKTGGKNE